MKINTFKEFVRFIHECTIANPKHSKFQLDENFYDIQEFISNATEEEKRLVISMAMHNGIANAIDIDRLYSVTVKGFIALGIIMTLHLLLTESDDKRISQLENELKKLEDHIQYCERYTKL